MDSEDIYDKYLNHHESEYDKWFNCAFDCMKDGDLEKIELMLEHLNREKGDLRDLEKSLLQNLLRRYDESDLRPETIDLASDYEIIDEGAENSFA